MKKIGVVVIGAGNIGQHHVRVYSTLKNVRLLAVCDSNIDTASRIARKYHTRAYKDYKKLIEENPNIDCASIAVPTSYHQLISTYFMKRNINVLLEKPIAQTLDDAEEILRTAESNQVKLMIGHVERFNPGVLKMKQLVKQGKLGKIISIVSKRVGVFPPSVSDMNVFLDLGIHEVDIINSIMEEHPQIIQKHAVKSHAARQEDAGEIFLLYKDAAAFIQVNWITPVKIRSLSITGTKGYAELDYINQTLTVHKAKLNKHFETYADFLRFSDSKTENISVEKAEPLRKEIEYFVDVVRGKKSLQMTQEEILQSLAICLK